MNHGKIMKAEYESLECRWFAKCTNEATGTLNAGPLGDVLICDRCRALTEKWKT